MSILKPEIIEDTNLSYAWGQAYLELIDRPQRRLSPLVLSITGFKDELPVEDLRIRQLLEAELATDPRKVPVDVSAMLIFPHQSWLRRGQPHCKEFSDWYLSSFLPRLKARDPQRNGRGTYFERMVASTGCKRSGEKEEMTVVNQLEHLVKIWKRDEANGTHSRQSALQVACFDPVKDHTGAAQSGFPCLQQISFSYADGNLAISAVYPTQYILDRGYGNYLGLCHLGHFMAREMGLRFSRLNCYVNHPDLGKNVSKESLAQLTRLMRGILAEKGRTSQQVLALEAA